MRVPGRDGETKILSLPGRDRFVRRRLELVHSAPPRRGGQGRDAYFLRQERLLDPLLAWALGNTLAGSALAVVGNGVPRAIGLQAALWGAMETVVVAGLQSAARRNAVAARSGELSARAIHDEARWFEHVLAINAGLGVAYIAGGTLLAVKGGAPFLRGTGAGILIQGSALLAYDVGLTAWAALRPEARVNMRTR
jgi:hypothetical protein